jgi:hypothetical protein
MLESSSVVRVLLRLIFEPTAQKNGRKWRCRKMVWRLTDWVCDSNEDGVGAACE